MQYAKYFIVCEQWRITSTVDDWGAPVETTVKVGDITGRMRPLSGDEQHTYGHDNTVSTHRFYTEAVVANDDVIRYDGKDYRVLYPVDLMTFDRLKQVECELIES